MITFHFSDRERSFSQSYSDFEGLHLVKELSQIILYCKRLKHQQKIIYGDCLAPSDLTLGDAERSQSRSLRFPSQCFLCCKEAEIGYILLLTSIGNHILDAQLQLKI